MVSTRASSRGQSPCIDRAASRACNSPIAKGSRGLGSGLEASQTALLPAAARAGGRWGRGRWATALPGQSTLLALFVGCPRLINRGGCHTQGSGLLEHWLEHAGCGDCLTGLNHRYPACRAAFGRLTRQHPRMQLDPLVFVCREKLWVGHRLAAHQ